MDLIRIAGPFLSQHGLFRFDVDWVHAVRWLVLGFKLGSWFRVASCGNLRMGYDMGSCWGSAQQKSGIVLPGTKDLATKNINLSGKITVPAAPLLEFHFLPDNIGWRYLVLPTYVDTYISQ